MPPLDSTQRSRLVTCKNCGNRKLVAKTKTRYWQARCNDCYREYMREYMRRRRAEAKELRRAA